MKRAYCKGPMIVVMDVTISSSVMATSVVGLIDNATIAAESQETSVFDSGEGDFEIKWTE